MKYVIFFVLLTIFCNVSHSDFTQFDFSVDRNLIDSDKDFKVFFKFYLVGYKEDDFLVRPLISNGLVEIFNDKNNKWVSSFEDISNFPYLKSEMRLRIKGLNVEKSSLHFEIYNTKLSEIYLTSAKDVWGKVYSGYIDRMNLGLPSKEILDERWGAQSVEILESVEIEGGNKVTDKFQKGLFLIVLGLVIFSILIFFGLKIILKRKSKRVLWGDIQNT